jgi:hypothetical protein
MLTLILGRLASRKSAHAGTKTAALNKALSPWQLSRQNVSKLHFGAFKYLRLVQVWSVRTPPGTPYSSSFSVDSCIYLLEVRWLFCSCWADVIYTYMMGVYTWPLIAPDFVPYWQLIVIDKSTDYRPFEHSSCKEEISMSCAFHASHPH